MTKWLKKFNDIMAAATFAESGEFETAKEMLRGQQRILLALTGEEPDMNAFKYAVSICKRIGAGMDVLCVNMSNSVIAGKQFSDKLTKEGINFEVIQASGCVKEAIIAHTNKKAGIQFVVVESENKLNIECKKNDLSLTKKWKELRCPLVVVTESTQG